MVVIYNASEDCTAQVAEELGVRRVRLETRHDFCRAMNAALASVDGDAVLFMQPDCFLTPGFVAGAPALAEDGVGSVAHAGGHKPAPFAAQHDAAGVLDVVTPHEEVLERQPVAVHHPTVDKQRDEGGRSDGHDPPFGAIDRSSGARAVGPEGVHGMHPAVAPPRGSRGRPQAHSAAAARRAVR